MAKNFSVEWLSQSSRGPRADCSECFLRSHESCSLAPQTARGNPADGSKQSSSGVDLLLQDAKDVNIKTPSSPNSCGDTSGSESDVCEDSEEETGPVRRIRTKFTSCQISQLERAFNKHKYLGATQRKKIAERLHLSETQVKTWFQNRRMKLKREVQDRQMDYFSPASVPPMLFPGAPTLQHYALSGQHLLPQPYQQQLHQQRLLHPALLLSSAYTSLRHTV